LLEARTRSALRTDAGGSDARLKPLQRPLVRAEPFRAGGCSVGAPRTAMAEVKDVPRSSSRKLLEVPGVGDNRDGRTVLYALDGRPKEQLKAMRVLGANGTGDTLWLAGSDHDGLIDLMPFQVKLPRALESGRL
jgi:hypothetical protein